MSADVTLSPINLIVVNKNDRTVFDPEKLQELAESIQANGLAQPVTVRPVPRMRGGICQLCQQPACGCQPDTALEMVAGERRLRACKLLGWETIPSLVRQMDDETAASIMLTENVRDDLNPIDEANAYKARMERFGWSVAKVARQGGVGKKQVESMLELLNLAEDIQRLVANGNITLGFARAMTKLDLNRQRLAVRFLNDSDKITLPMFRHIVSDLYAEQTQESLFDLALWTGRIEQIEQWVASGKNARVPVPTHPKAPAVKHDNKSTVGDIMYNYIADLLAAELENEAAAVGTLFETLLKGNFIRLNAPPERKLKTMKA